MVAIIRCIPEEEKLLSWRARNAEDVDLGEVGLDWVATRLSSQWKGGHVALLITGRRGDHAAVEYLARAATGRRSGTLNHEIKVTHIHPVAPRVFLSELGERLPGRHRDVLESDGCLPKKGGEVLLDTLVTLRPGLRKIVDELRGIDDRIPLRGPAGQLLLQQRDAVGLALQAAGFDRGVISQARSLDEQLNGNERPDFLKTVNEGTAGIEDQIITHDTEYFAGLRALPAQDATWRTFRDGDRSLVIGNVNRTPVERALGVDLIYYHLTRKSFVLLQYKRMTGQGNDWAYYPRADQHLEKELERMSELDTACAKRQRSEDDYRLVSTPSWIKLSPESAVLPRGDELWPGIYLSQAHFKQLLSNPQLLRKPKTRSDRGGARFGYDTIPRYIGTTSFTTMVQDGWIGSVGAGSEYVREAVEDSLAGQRSVVWASLIAQDEPQAKRTGDRRQGQTSRQRRST